MAKMEFSRELTRKAIRTLIRYAEMHRGRQFNIGKYRIVPKALYICEGSGCFYVFTFSQNIPNVRAVVVDVGGIHPKYATQLELREDGSVIVTPSERRGRDEIRRFLEEVASG